MCWMNLDPKTKLSWSHWTGYAGVLCASIYLFYKYDSNDCVPSSSSIAANITANAGDMLFNTEVVVLLNKTCHPDSGLFAVLMISAAFLQYSRQAIAWKQTQMQRCILRTKREARFDNASNNDLWWFHWYTFCASALYLVSISFILTQNMYVFISITLGNLLCEHVVLRWEKSDNELCGTTKKRPDVRTDVPPAALQPPRKRFML